MMIGLIAISFCALLQFGAEATIEVVFEDMEMLIVDPEYFDPSTTEVSIRENDDGENVMVSAITVRKSVPDDSKAHVTVMGLSMGLYKIPTGIDVTMKICELVDEPVIMGPLVKAFGFTKETCPPPPGTYTQDGYVPPMDLMPDSFVENKYRGIFEIIAGTKVVLSVAINMDIQV